MSENKVTKRKHNSNKSSDSTKKDDPKQDKAPKYGPMPKISSHRIWSRSILIIGIAIYIWFFSKTNKNTILAKQNEIYPKRGQTVDCDRDYLDEIRKYPSCVPKKCGRYISDKIVTGNEADALLRVASRAMALGSSDGGASILDLHSGALSYKDKFVNIYSLETHTKFISAADFAIYRMVKTKIQHAIAENFGIDSDSLYLTHPTFFSRLTNDDPVTPHDEYWHVHVDKETYESFHYTSLVYLNDYGIDFQGGSFIFLDNLNDPYKNVTVEPRKGRVSMFTSGAENPHYVERVIQGNRYAITVSFSCDKSKSISDPTFK